VAPTKDNQSHRLLVKQKYELKCDERGAEYLKNFNFNILKETSRVIKSDGTVIKFMNDKSVEIYHSNGTIIRKVFNNNQEKNGTLSEKVETLLNEKEISNNTTTAAAAAAATAANKKKDKKKEQQAQQPQQQQQQQQQNLTAEQLIQPLDDTIKWTLITPYGNEYTINNSTSTEIDKDSNELTGHHRIIEQNDIESGELMLTREDHLKTVYRPDGSYVVEFADGTRITTFRAQQNNNDSTKYIKVECKGFASVIFNTSTSDCTLAFGTNTLVSCNPSRMLYNLTYHSGELLDINKNGIITFTPQQNQPETGNEDSKSVNKYIFYANNNNQNKNNTHADTILEHVDNNNNKFTVNKDGKTNSIPFDIQQEQKDPKVYSKHAPRFFIIHQDSTGTELLRYADIQNYMLTAEFDPLTAIIRENVQGYPKLMGTTVLSPLKDCLTDNWIIDYDEKDITPIGLRTRNLRTFPSNPAVKVGGSEFGSRMGKGLFIYNNQFMSQRAKNPPVIIAKRMAYRQLIEYQLLNEQFKQKLIDGLKNYMIYIAERAENHRLLLTHDPRTENEKLTATKYLKLALTTTEQISKGDITDIYKESINTNKGNQNDNYLLSNNNKNIKKLLINENSRKRFQNLQNHINKEKENKQAWKDKFVPSYFESEWGQMFLNTISINNNSNSKEYFQKSENNFNNNNDNNNNNNNTNKVLLQKQKLKQKLDQSKPIENTTKSTLPPLNDTNLNQNKSTIRRYKAQFKHTDRLDQSKLPNSIKTTRENAIPNSLVSRSFYIKLN
jgi:hypothetical protein